MKTKSLQLKLYRAYIYCGWIISSLHAECLTKCVKHSVCKELKTLIIPYYYYYYKGKLTY